MQILRQNSALLFVCKQETFFSLARPFSLTEDVLRATFVPRTVLVRTLLAGLSTGVQKNVPPLFH